MKENRSFDQMLDYLMRDGLPDVDGLTGEEVNFVGEGEAALSPRSAFGAML
jgi:hypothetical protein